MRRIKVKQVDAFTTVPFGGNPAAVVIDAEGLTEEEMQRIAREMNLSETAFVASSEQGDFFIAHVFTLGSFSEEADAHARHFAPAAGVREDSGTGSASGGMAAYLVHYGLVDKSSLVAEQGHLIGRPGLAYIDLEKEGNEMTTVKVDGSAVTVMNGEIFF
jgi:trans-2,3-dihydro-3-hydroxyanthranilate isomerase